MGSSPPPEAPDASRPLRGRSAGLAALLGWLVPGLGHVYAARPLKALLFFAAIVPTFGLGLALTDFTAVNPKRYGLEFAAQVWAGGPTALALHWTRGHALEEMPRWFDVGRLYVAVAGLLNVVALSDLLSEVLRHNREAARRRRLAEAALRASLVDLLPDEGVPADGLPEDASGPPAAPATAPSAEDLAWDAPPVPPAGPAPEASP